MTLFVLMLCFCSIFDVSTVKVYTFESVSEEQLSYMTLSSTSSVEIPDQFILCSSHQQSKIDNRGFYHILQSDGSPWMTSVFEDMGLKSVGLWGMYGVVWSYFGVIESPKVYFWYHLCHSVDSTKGLVSIAINGKMMQYDIKSEGLKHDPPKYLRNQMVLGKSVHVMPKLENIEKQFHGSVSNINMFTKGNLSISYLSANPCRHQGDLLSWSDSSWLQTGAGVKVRDSDPAQVCDNAGSYDLGLTIAMDQQEAVDTCHKLGKGSMRVTSNQQQLQDYVHWFARDFPGACTRFWTPYSDMAEEGVYVSLEDHSVPGYLPWGLGQPNGRTAENGVEFRMDLEGNTIEYFDVYQHIQGCFACSLSSFFSLDLKGLCEHTLLGK